jgi:hypothetical protein
VLSKYCSFKPEMIGLPCLAWLLRQCALSEPVVSSVCTLLQQGGEPLVLRQDPPQQQRPALLQQPSQPSVLLLQQPPQPQTQLPMPIPTTVPMPVPVPVYMPQQKPQQQQQQQQQLQGSPLGGFERMHFPSLLPAVTDEEREYKGRYGVPVAGELLAHERAYYRCVSWQMLPWVSIFHAWICSSTCSWDNPFNVFETLLISSTHTGNAYLATHTWRLHTWRLPARSHHAHECTCMATRNTESAAHWGALQLMFATVKQVN